MRASTAIRAAAPLLALCAAFTTSQAQRAVSRQPAPVIMIDGRPLTVRSHPGWVEIGLPRHSDNDGAAVGVMTPLGVEEPSRAAVRQLFHPDSIVKLADSIERWLESSSSQWPGIGEWPGMRITLSPSAGPASRVALAGCGARRLEARLDTARARVLAHRLRAVALAARRDPATRERASRVGARCAPQPHSTNAVPSLSRELVADSAPPDADALLSVDEQGRVMAVALRWAVAPAARTYVTRRLHEWRFTPVRADTMAMPDTVRLRMRFRPAAPAPPAVAAARFAALRRSAATAGADYLLLGTIVPGLRDMTVPSGGVPLRVGDGGARVGLPTVIVHGAGGRSAQWSTLVGPLRSHRRVISYDLRGHGASGQAADYSVAAHAADLRAILDSLRLSRVVLAAHGTGASVAVEFARAHPDRVAGVLMIAPAGDYRRSAPGLPSVLDTMLLEAGRTGPGTALRPYFPRDDALQLDLVVRDIRATPRRALEETIRSTMAYDLMPALTTSTPMLMLLPAFGPGTERRPPYADDSTSVVPAATINGGGRWMFLVRRDDVRASIEAFVYTIESMGRTR